MEYTIKKVEEIKAYGYKELGIYTTGSKEIVELIKNRSYYKSILLKKLNSEGTILSIFVKR